MIYFVFGTPGPYLCRSRCAETTRRWFFQVPVTDRGHTHNASSMTNLISSVLSTWPQHTPYWLFFFLSLGAIGNITEKLHLVLYETVLYIYARPAAARKPLAVTNLQRTLMLYQYCNMQFYKLLRIFWILHGSISRKW